MLAFLLKSPTIAILLRILLWGAALYLLFAFLIYLGQRRYIYQPSPLRIVQGRLPELPPGFVPWLDDGQIIGYRRETGAANALFFLHGNGGHGRDWAFATADFPGDVYVLEYPGYGERPGVPTEQTLKRAALEAYDRIPDYPNKIVCGQSLGTGVTPAIFLRRPVRSLVLVTPFTSLLDVARSTFPILPVRWMLKDPMELFEPWQSFTGSTTVVLAEADEVVPRAASLPFAEVRKPQYHLIRIPNAGHNDAQVTADMWHSILRETERK